MTIREFRKNLRLYLDKAERGSTVVIDRRGVRFRVVLDKDTK